MAHVPPDVVDISAQFAPQMVGAAMAKLWSVDGPRLVPLLDAHGGTAECCPITYQRAEDPVLLCDGRTYERTDALKWLLDSNTSPWTLLELRHKHALKLEPLREAFECLLSKQPLTGRARLPPTRGHRARSTHRTAIQHQVSRQHQITEQAQGIRHARRPVRIQTAKEERLGRTN